MKITVDLFDLNTVIQAMDRATKFECGDSVFDAVRFTVEGGKLKVDAYDGLDGVHVTLEADEVYALEDGSAVVHLRELAPILRQIKACAIVRIEAAVGEVWMHFEKLSYKFEEPDEKPYQFVGKIEKVFKKRERTVGFFADAVSLKHDISRVKSAMADYERRTLAGVHCEMEGCSVRFVATNGRVIVEHSHVADNLEKKPDGVGFIPRRFVRMLEVLLKEFPFKAHVGFDRDGGRVDIGVVVSLVWEFESAFPEWRGVIPTEKAVDSIEIMNVRELVSALDTVNRTWDRVEDEDGEMDTGLADECVLATDGKGGMVITGAPVAIPIHPRLKMILGKRGKDSEYISPEIAATYERDDSRVSKLVRRVFEAAGIATNEKRGGWGKARPTASFHSLRHMFVSRSIEAGVAPAIVQALVGHSSAAMTEHYTHVSAEAMEEAFRRLG